MYQKLVSFLQYALFLGLGIFLVAWSLRKIDQKEWTDIFNAFANARYLLILPVIIALEASHISRAQRWNILIEPLGHKPKLANTYMAILIGYLANLAVPRLGEVLRCTVLARYEKIPADKLIGTIVAERAFDVVGLIVVLMITFFSQTDIIGTYLSGRIDLLLQSYQSPEGKNKLLIIGAVALFLIFLFRFLLHRFAHISFMQKVKTIIIGVWHGLTSVRYIKKKSWFLFHTVFIWCMYLISIQISMYAMQETSLYDIKASLSVLATGSIAMILTPSGIGAYPIFVQETMALYGLKHSIGIAFGWLMWTAQFFVTLIGGFMALAILPYINKKKQDA